MYNIAIIDDDNDICQLLSRFLTKNDFGTSTFNSGNDALGVIKEKKFDVILCDYKLPDLDGIELLRKIKIFNPEAVVIIITGYSDVRIAVDALRHGAFDYVVKPLYPDEILHTINNGLKKSKEKKTIARSKPEIKEYIEGDSPQSRNVQKLVDLIAPTDMSVIITGETGTGKEFVANAIHRKSKRKDYPFVAIDCGAIPKDIAGSELFGHVKGAFTGALNNKTGSFEAANGGTLFLDEIGNLSYDNQVKLLRVLQERKVKKLGSTKDIPIDVRLIVATNENLRDAINENKFREDIFHRLNEFQIELTPLRERVEDIMIFAEYFLSQSNLQLNKDVEGFTDRARNSLMNYKWYGNLRELKNVIKRGVLLTEGKEMDTTSLPREIVNPAIQEVSNASELLETRDLKKAQEIAERAVILNTLERVGFNKSKAAKELKIDRKTLYNKLRAYKIDI